MKKLGFRSIKSTILFGGFAIITLICLTILSISSMLSYNAFREQVEEDMPTEGIRMKKLLVFLSKERKRQDLNCSLL